MTTNANRDAAIQKMTDEARRHEYNGRVYFGRCWCGLPKSAPVHKRESGK